MVGSSLPANNTVFSIMSHSSMFILSDLRDLWRKYNYFFLEVLCSPTNGRKFTNIEHHSKHNSIDPLVKLNMTIFTYLSISRI